MDKSLVTGLLNSAFCLFHPPDTDLPQLSQRNCFVPPEILPSLIIGDKITSRKRMLLQNTHLSVSGVVSTAGLIVECMSSIYSIGS